MNKKHLALFILAALNNSVHAETIIDGAVISDSIMSRIEEEIGSSFSVPAVERIIQDVKEINNTTIKPNSVKFDGYGDSHYNSSSLSGMLNGHAVKVYTADGTVLGMLDANSGGRPINDSQLVNLQNRVGYNPQALSNTDSRTGTKYYYMADGSDPEIRNPANLIVEVDGQKIFGGDKVTRADVLDLIRALDVLPATNAISSTNLGSASPSTMSSQLIYSKMEGKVSSHKQKRRAEAEKNSPQNVNFAIGDLKYEQAEFTKSHDSGDIKGLVMAISRQFGDYELGAYIPYDYLDFRSFNAHRTGTIIYGKRDWQLPSDLQLTTMVNFNYVATYVTELSLTNTFGGGFGTSLRYDNGGDFVPSISFALQYNQDDYYKANSYVKDKEQYLVKTGAGLGYRLFDNATLQGNFSYNRDVTDYTSGSNKMKDNDYFDITAGGTYTVSDMWQVNLNYRRILGLDTYYSNTVFLGTTLGF